MATAGVVRLLVAGLGLRPVRLSVPALVARWVLPSGLVLENGVPIGSIIPPMGCGTDGVFICRMR